MSSLTVELVAADRLVWQGEARQVNARSVDGELGILPGHEPLLTLLGEGAVVIRGIDGASHSAQIDEGFLAVDRDHVTLVAEHVTVTEA